jgi:hypothetical protein
MDLENKFMGFHDYIESAEDLAGYAAEQYEKLSGNSLEESNSLYELASSVKSSLEGEESIEEVAESYERFKSENPEIFERKIGKGADEPIDISDKI